MQPKYTAMDTNSAETMLNWKNKITDYSSISTIHVFRCQNTLGTYPNNFVHSHTYDPGHNKELDDHRFAKNRFYFFSKSGNTEEFYLSELCYLSVIYRQINFAAGCSSETHYSCDVCIVGNICIVGNR